MPNWLAMVLLSDTNRLFHVQHWIALANQCRKVLTMVNPHETIALQYRHTPHGDSIMSKDYDMVKWTIELSIEYNAARPARKRYYAVAKTKLEGTDISKVRAGHSSQPQTAINRAIENAMTAARWHHGTYGDANSQTHPCLLYTSPSPRD